MGEMDTRIRVLDQRAYNDTLFYVELAGPADATKPTTGIVTGSLFWEIDAENEKTTVKAFDEGSADWYPIGGAGA